MAAILAAAVVPILTSLIQNGLGTIAGAVEAKGKQVVEQKLGVKIPDTPVGMTPDKIAELQQAQMKHEEWLVQAQMQSESNAQDNVTKRWQADMASDVWLAKNIRPLVLAGLFILLIGMVVADALGATFSKETYDLVGTAINIVFVAYFTARSVEKGLSIWRGRSPNVGG